MKKYFQAPWNIKDLVYIVATSIFLTGLLLLILKYLDVKQYFDLKSSSLIPMIIGFLSQWLIIFLPLIFFSVKKYKLSLANFGFHKIKFWTSIKEIFKAYLLYVGISILVSIIVISFDLKIPGYQVQQNILPLFGDNLPGIATAGIVVILLAPLFEEIFFRGFLLRTLSDKMGIYLGSIVSALIFALVHFPWQSIIPIFILGLIINSIVIRTKSVWPALGFHLFNNAIVFIFELLITKDVISIEKLT